MSKSKKIMALLTTLAMTLILTACGNDSDTEAIINEFHDDYDKEIDVISPTEQYANNGDNAEQPIYDSKIYTAFKSLQGGPYTYTTDTLTVYGDGNKMVMINESDKMFILDGIGYQFDDENKIAYSYTVNSEWSFLDTLIDWVENGTLIDSGYADFMGTEVYFEEIRLISGEVYRFFFNGDDLLGEWNAQNNVYSTAFIAKGTPLDIFELPE